MKSRTFSTHVIIRYTYGCCASTLAALRTFPSDDFFFSLSATGRIKLVRHPVTRLLYRVFDSPSALCARTQFTIRTRRHSKVRTWFVTPSVYKPHIPRAPASRPDYNYILHASCVSSWHGRMCRKTFPARSTGKFPKTSSHVRVIRERAVRFTLELRKARG